MTKANITQYDSTPSNNADINDINIAENCPASNINNAIRELMSHLKNVDTGSQALTALSVAGSVTVAGNIEKTSGALTVDSAGSITLDCGDGELLFNNSGNGNLLKIQGDSSNVNFISMVQDKDIRFKGNDGGSFITAMTIDMSEGGNVGIGTSSPSQKLHVAGGNPVGIIESTTGSGSFLQFKNTSSSGTNRLGYAVHDFVIDTNGSERMRIDSSGKLLINTSSTLGSSQGVLHLKGASDNTVCAIQVASNGERGLDFRNTSNTEVGSVTVGASSTSYNTSSDYRLKENVTYDFDATTRLKQLKPCRFNFIADPKTTVDGFIAHEVTAVPEAITGEKDAMTKEVLYVDGDEIPEGKKVGDVKEASKIDPQGIDQSKLVPLLTKALQEQQATIEALTARITALENA